MAQQYTPESQPPPYAYPPQPVQPPQRSNTLLYVLIGLLLGCCACFAILCLMTILVPSLIFPIAGPAMGTAMPEIFATWEAILTITP